MIRMMMIGLTASSVALAGGVTSQAQAGDKKLGRILAGAAVLFIIAKSMEDDRPQPQPDVLAMPLLQPQPEPLPEFLAEPQPEPQLRPLRRELTGEPLELASAKPMTLPSACAFEVNGSFGAETVAGRDCLNANFQGASSLPAFCAKSIETNQGSRQVFDLGCLENWGYTVEARR
jgi:hypothetical protein